MIEYESPDNILPENVLSESVSSNRSSKKYPSSKSKSKSESIDEDMINNATSITRRRIPRSASEIMDQIEDEEKNIYNRFSTRIQKHGAFGIIYAVLHECELISSCLMNTSKRLKRFFHVGQNSVQPELS